MQTEGPATTKSAKKDEKSQGFGATMLAQLMLPLAEMVRRDLRELVITLGMQHGE